MPDGLDMPGWLVSAVMVVAVMVCAGGLAWHWLKAKKPDEVFHVEQGAAQGMAWSEVMLRRAVEASRSEFRSLSRSEMPAAGSVFVDEWDIAEAFGASGKKNAVIIDGVPRRSGDDPALAFETRDGKLVRTQ